MNAIIEEARRANTKIVITVKEILPKTKITENKEDVAEVFDVSKLSPLCRRLFDDMTI